VAAAPHGGCRRPYGPRRWRGAPASLARGCCRSSAASPKGLTSGGGDAGGQHQVSVFLLHRPRWRVDVVLAAGAGLVFRATARSAGLAMRAVRLSQFNAGPLGGRRRVLSDRHNGVPIGAHREHGEINWDIHDGETTRLALTRADQAARAHRPGGGTHRSSMNGFPDRATAFPGMSNVWPIECGTTPRIRSAVRSRTNH
jgi:hypothetical protein